MNFYKAFETLPKWARIVFVLCTGLISANYRILRYLESKNEKTLLFGVLAIVPGAGLIVQVLDIIAIINDEKFKFFVD